jgi:hypothetical protein
MPQLHQMMRPVDDSVRATLHNPEREPNFYACAAIASPVRVSIPRRPPPLNPEMEALEGLHSLSRGNSLRPLSPMVQHDSFHQYTETSNHYGEYDMSANLLIAEEFHDLSIRHLHAAKSVTDSERVPISFNHGLYPRMTCMSRASKPDSLTPLIPSLQSLHKRRSLPLPKKSQRKWLPSLGPSDLSIGASPDAWCHINAEAFASLNEESSDD